MFRVGQVIGFEKKLPKELITGKIIRVDPTSGVDVVYYVYTGEKTVHKIKFSEVEEFIVMHENDKPEPEPEPENVKKKRGRPRKVPLIDELNKKPEKNLTNLI